MTEKVIAVDKADPRGDDMVVTVNTGALKALVKDGEQIVFKPEAEEALIQLLELQGIIDGAVKTAKRNIEQTALAYNPNFTSVQGTRVKVGYQFFGSKYAIDESKLDKLPQDLYTDKHTYSPKGPAIEKYLKEHKALPLGILERERTKSITIKLIDDFSEAE